MPSKAMIRVVVTATQEFNIPVEEGAILSSNGVRELIQKELPNCRLTLSTLRLASVPESAVGSGVDQELATDDMKDTLAFRLVTNSGTSALNIAPAVDVHTGASFVQVDTAGPASYSLPPPEQSSTGTENAPIKARRKPRHQKNTFKDQVPAFEPNTVGNRVRKRKDRAEKRKQARIDRAVKAHQQKQDKPEPRMVTYFHDSKIDEKAKQHGLANTLSEFARKRNLKVRKKLQKAAERRWGGQDDGLTDDKKVDMIADQLAKAFDSSKKH